MARDKASFIRQPPERVPTGASMAAAVRFTPKPISVSMARTVDSSAPQAITYKETEEGTKKKRERGRGTLVMDI